MAFLVDGQGVGSLGLAGPKREAAILGLPSLMKMRPASSRKVGTKCGTERASLLASRVR